MNALDAHSVVAADPFAAARDWFRAQGYTPFAFQEAVWQERRLEFTYQRGGGCDHVAFLDGLGR